MNADGGPTESATPPWILERDGSAGWVLSSLANDIVRSPDAMLLDETGASLPEGVVGPMLTVGHGTIRVHLPVIGTWPLDRTDPTRIVAELRRLSEACHGDASHEMELLPFMRAAVALAVADGTMPEDAIVSDGCHLVEVCIDTQTSAPMLYVAVEGDGGSDFFRMAAPKGPDMPAWRVPCRIDERQDGSTLHVVMTFAITDADGITSDDVRVDSMDVLRIATMRRKVDAA